jgi:hypothetical protein
VVRWTGGAVDRWYGGTGGTVAPVAGAPMTGGPVIHRHRCIPSTSLPMISVHL